MGDSYEVSWDVATNRLTFRLHGAWTAQTAATWEQDYVKAMGGAPRPSWTLLGDLSDYPPQSEDVQKVHQDLMVKTWQRGCSKAALVVPQAVAALQIKRLGRQAGVEGDPRLKYVTSVAEADKWLR